MDDDGGRNGRQTKHKCIYFMLYYVIVYCIETV